MAAKRPPQTTQIDLNLAPMVDVMMCLLIFFMLATKMVEREHTAVDLPTARSATDPDTTETMRRVVINVTPGAAADQPPQFQIGDRPMSLAEMEKHLLRERAANSELRCVIRADRELEYRHIEDILMVCARVKIGNLVFAAAQDADTGGV